MSAPNVAVARRTTCREKPTAPTAMGHTIPYRTCATAARAAATTHPSTAHGGAPRATGTPTAGNTTSNHYERAGRISLGNANTNVSLAVVTG